MSFSTARSFCFTSFEMEIKFNEDQIYYAVWQPEICPDTGKLHLQGYVEFKAPKSLGQLKKIDAKAHWEKRKGTPDEARAYCMKSDTRIDGCKPIELGEWRHKRQGERTDLNEIKAIIDTVGMNAVAELHFPEFVRFHRGFEKYQRLKENENERTWMTELIWIYGPSGSGKTSFVFETNKVSLFPMVDNTAQWFDGYNGQLAVLFDDVGVDDKPKITLLLKLADRYRMQVPVKCGFVNWCPYKIYITSNLHPDEVYEHAPKGNMIALHRRMKIMTAKESWDQRTHNGTLELCEKEQQ